MAKSVDIPRMEIGSQAVFVGKILEIKRKLSKKSQKPYGYVSIVDLSGRFELMLFEKQLNALDTLNIEQPLAFKCKIEEQEEVARLRLLEMDTLENIKGVKIPKARYKNNPEEVQMPQPLDIAKDFQADSSCLLTCQDEQHIPLSIVLDTSVSLELFAKLKDAAQSHKGERALSLIFHDQDKRFKFNTALKVNSAIKQSFQAYEWLDL
ncbi:DNA polymerase III alpha subunit [Helicobacter bizzozeronii CCUG 35545]|nr:DNA polymerase III alpha subunit [Helicobacter bizzozeronii CCUG 35545]